MMIMKQNCKEGCTRYMTFIKRQLPLTRCISILFSPFFHKEDNGSDDLSCCDTINTEDLTRRGVTRQMSKFTHSL